MNKELVAVTGSSGYVAGQCILQLIQQGYRVRGTLRSLERAPEVRSWLEKGLGHRTSTEELGFVAADLRSDHGWEEAMTGAQFVLHVASPIPSKMPKHEDELLIPAREGTLRVMRAASKAGVKRVVQTSSSAAASYGVDNPNERVFTEEDWSNPNHPDNVPYTRSKTLAERTAWDELARAHSNIEWVSILPGLVLGPVLDKDASASVQVVAKMLNGELPGIPRFGFTVVDVRDIADLHLRAMQAPQAAGQRYLGSGSFVMMTEIAQILRDKLGSEARKVPVRRLPDWLVKMVGLFDAEVRGQLFELGRKRRFSSAKAERDLGWRSRPVADTIVDTATSLRGVGALRQ